MPGDSSVAATSRGFDTVCVPDFENPAASLSFEWRTLFFLASWIEHAGAARAFPVHLACIGKPPRSVRRLAEQCGAEITVHRVLDAVPAARICNKLRGFEITPHTDRGLLIDADTMFLRDPSELATGPAAVAAAPASFPNLPERYWKRIYPAVGLRLPEERMRSLVSEFDVPTVKPEVPERNHEIHRMVPYYNGGVLFFPWRSELCRHWHDDMVTISQLFDEKDPLWYQVAGNDQTGLATSLARLEQLGEEVERLPDVFNSRFVHWSSSAYQVDQTVIFHAIGFLRGVRQGDDLRHHVFAYRNACFQRFLRIEIDRFRASQKASRAARFVTGIARSWSRARRLSRVVERLYARHVEGALAEESAQGR